MKPLLVTVLVATLVKGVVAALWPLRAEEAVIWAHASWGVGPFAGDAATRLGVTPGCPNFTSDFALLQTHAFFRGLNCLFCSHRHTSVITYTSGQALRMACTACGITPE